MRILCCGSKIIDPSNWIEEKWKSWRSANPVLTDPLSTPGWLRKPKSLKFNSIAHNWADRPLRATLLEGGIAWAEQSRRLKANSQHLTAQESDSQNGWSSPILDLQSSTNMHYSLDPWFALPFNQLLNPVQHAETVTLCALCDLCSTWVLPPGSDTQQQSIKSSVLWLCA